MALAKQWWKLSAQFRDRANKTTTREWRLVPTDTAGDATDVLAAAATVIANYQAASDCKIISYTVGAYFLDTAFAIPTAATALNTVVASITNQVHEHPNESAVYDIPGPKDLVFLAASGDDADNVNFAQDEVDAIQDMYSIAGTNLLYISDGETLNTNVHSGVRATKKRRKP